MVKHQKFEARVLLSCLLLGALPTFGHAAAQDAIVAPQPASPNNATHASPLTPNAAADQQKLLAFLAAQTNTPIAKTVAIPLQIVDWFHERHAAEDFSQVSPEENRARSLILLKEDLEVARRLFNNTSQKERRRGLLLMTLILPRWISHADDSVAITAPMIEGFVLPFIEDAHRDFTLLLSRVQLLQWCSVVYEQAQEQDKMIAVLQRLIVTASEDDSLANDWARFKLAPLLQEQGKQKEAQDTLQAIEAPSLHEAAQDILHEWQGASPLKTP